MNSAREQALRGDIVRWSRSLFERGLTPGSSGNISVRLHDGFLATPTDSCLGFLEADRLSKVDVMGAHIAGDAPTKELHLHLAFYQTRPQAGAVVHLHSTYATLLSCLGNVDSSNAVPPITPYVVMRLGRVPVVHPYLRPGSMAIANRAREFAGEHAAILLANHGPVVSGVTLESAISAAEELEETAKLVVLARGSPVRCLSADHVAELEATFGKQ